MNKAASVVCLLFDACTEEASCSYHLEPVGGNESLREKMLVGWVGRGGVSGGRPAWEKFVKSEACRTWSALQGRKNSVFKDGRSPFRRKRKLFQSIS